MNIVTITPDDLMNLTSRWGWGYIAVLIVCALAPVFTGEARTGKKAGIIMMAVFSAPTAVLYITTVVFIGFMPLTNKSLAWAVDHSPMGFGALVYATWPAWLVLAFYTVMRLSIAVHRRNVKRGEDAPAIDDFRPR